MQLGRAFYVDFESNLAPTWPQLGAKLGPKIAWKSILRGSKIELKFKDWKISFFYRFWFDCWSIFNRCLIDFGAETGTKISKMDLETNTSKLWKLSSRVHESSNFEDLRALTLLIKINQKINQKSDHCFNHFFIDVGSILGSKLEPKSRKNRSKNLSKKC